MAEEVHPGSWLGDSVEEYKKLPTWGKVAAGGAVAVVAFLGYRAYVSGRSSAGATASTGGTSGTGGTLSGGQVASGQDTSGGLQSPFAQVPSGPNSTSVPVLPAGLQPVLDGVGNLIGWQPQAPQSPPPTPVATPTPTPSLIEQIRDRFSSSSAQSYDQKFTGVPVRSAPGGAVTGTLPFGSDVTLASLTPVSGPSNFGGKTPGSNIWYKTASGGYVSQYDVRPTVQSVYNSTQPPAVPKVGS